MVNKKRHILKALTWRLIASNEGGKWGESEVTFLEDNWIRIILKDKFKSRRGKINCTLRLKDKSWGWFGRQYVILN